MPKLTKKLAVELLGDVKTIEAGRASGRFGRVSNQEDVSDDEPLSLFELPENWRNAISHASAFVCKDLESSLSKCSYLLDGHTLSAVGPYAAIKVPFGIPEHDGIPICLPSEIGWQHLPGLGAAILASYADRLVVSQEVWSVTSARMASFSPPLFERAFKDEEGYQTIEVAYPDALIVALESGPSEIQLDVAPDEWHAGRDGVSIHSGGVRLSDFAAPPAWTPRQAILPTIEGLTPFEPIAVDSALLLNAFRAVGQGAILAVRGPLDAIQIFGLSGEHAVIMPLKPKAEGKAA